MCACVRASLPLTLILPSSGSLIHPSLSGRVHCASALAVNAAPLVFAVSGIRFSAEGPITLVSSCQSNGRCLKVSPVRCHVLHSLLTFVLFYTTVPAGKDKGKFRVHNMKV